MGSIPGRKCEFRFANRSFQGILQMNIFSRFSGFVRNLTKRSACWLLLASSIFGSAAMATEPVIKGRTIVRISEVGESDVNVSLTTQLTYYSALKQLGGNFNLLARQIGMDDRNWNKQSPLDGSFIDSNNEIELKFRTPGAARNVKGNQWVLPLGRAETCQLVSATASHVTLMTAESTEIGLGTMVMDIELPAGATNAKFDSEKQEIFYNFEPEVTNGMAAESYAQSIAASQTDDECVAFMSATFHFLKSNHIAYQSPPGMLTQGSHGQPTIR